MPARNSRSNIGDIGWEDGSRIRTYGISGPLVIVLHGGPAAAGNAAPVARGLSGPFRVCEPWQRRSGGNHLTVARHVADLHDLVRMRCRRTKPALVGESWGAMLALAYAAAHAEYVGPIVLIGCGTFDEKARAQLTQTLEKRKDDGLKRRLKRLPTEFPDPDRQLMETYELTKSLYSYDPIATGDIAEDEPFDMRAHKETWADMIRLQEEGIYPAAFAAVNSPAIMLHGAYDPHPGRMIHDSLKPYIPQLEYHEWERCGHSPWLEKGVRDDFFTVMRDWLTRKFKEYGNATDR